MVPVLTENPGHFEAKLNCSLKYPFTCFLSKSDFFLYFYRLCTYINFTKCSHCIINYLYLYLGILRPNVISMRAGLESYTSLLPYITPKPQQIAIHSYFSLISPPSVST